MSPSLTCREGQEPAPGRGSPRQARPQVQVLQCAAFLSRHAPEPHPGDLMLADGSGALEQVVQMLSFDDCGDGQGPGTTEAAASDAGSSPRDLSGESMGQDGPPVAPGATG